MKLIEFLKTMPLKKRETFAEGLGSSSRHLHNIAYGCKPCGEALAIEIEKATEGQVTCEELRSDVDWAYLRGTQPKTNSKPEAA